MFVQMLYQLLCHGKFPFKSKKIICIGKSDSGKTSWLIPIIEILDDKEVVTVTNEGKFAAHMMEETTQLLYLDEWNPG